MIEQKLWDYLDGFLDPHEMQEVERYLESNEEARQRFEEFKNLNSLITGHNVILAPSEFSQGVMAQIRPKKSFSLSIKSLLPFWLFFIGLNLAAIIITKGEGLLPDSSLINLTSISQWLPYLDMFGMIGIGVTMLYFLDKLLSRRSTKMA